MTEGIDYFSSYRYFDADSYINRDINEHDAVHVHIPNGGSYPGRVEYDNITGSAEAYIVACNDEHYEPNYQYKHNFGDLFPALLSFVDSVVSNTEDYVSAAAILTSTALDPTAVTTRPSSSVVVAKVEHAMIDRGIISVDTILRNPTSGTLHRCENKQILPAVVFTNAYLTTEPGLRARAAATAGNFSFVVKQRDDPRNYAGKQVYLGLSHSRLADYEDGLAIEWNVFDPGVIQNVLTSVQESVDRIDYEFKGYTARRGCYFRSPCYLRYRASDICENFPIGFASPIFIGSSQPLCFPPSRVDFPVGILPLKVHDREKATKFVSRVGRALVDEDNRVIYPLELGDPVSARSWLLARGVCRMAPCLFRDEVGCPERQVRLLFPFSTRMIAMGSQIMRPLRLPVTGIYDSGNPAVLPPHLRPVTAIPDGYYYSCADDYLCFGPTHDSVSNYVPYGKAKLIGTPPASSWSWANTIAHASSPLLYPPSYIWYCSRILSTAPQVLGFADAPLDVDSSGFIPFEF